MAFTESWGDAGVVSPTQSPTQSTGEAAAGSECSNPLPVRSPLSGLPVLPSHEERVNTAHSKARVTPDTAFEGLPPRARKWHQEVEESLIDEYIDDSEN